MKGEKRYLSLTLALALGLLVLLGLAGGAHPPTALAQAGTGIIRVATTGDDVPGCGSEAAPCRSIQHAVDEALPGEQICVASGVYTSVNAYSGLAQVVYLSKTLALRGGYTLTNWTEPDPEANPTTLDAEGLGRVLVVSGTISPTVEGLRLTGGDATGLGGSPGEHDTGGSVYVYAAAATISNCLVYSNTASTADQGFGGGLYLFGSNGVTLNANLILSNTASTDYYGIGGGVFLDNSDVTLSDNTVRGNVASIADWGWGGGLFVYQSQALVEDNTIVSNMASITSLGWGGGLHIDENDEVVLVGNTVQGNTASVADGGYGGGLDLWGSDATLVGNTVQDNVASENYAGFGGGLALYDSDGAILQGNWIQNNHASIDSLGSGGGLWISESDITLEANAIVSNTATLSPTAEGWGGGLRVESGTTLTLTNNVVAGNQANAGADGTGDGLWLDAGWGMPINGRLLHNTLADNVGPAGSGQGIYAGAWVTLTLSNTIVSGHEDVGVYAGSGSVISLEGTLWHGNGADTGGKGTIITGTVNVYGDPAFVDPATGDYHLGPGSAAIDAGMDAGVTTDIDGDPRPLGLGYDIGADEADLVTTGCYARLNNGPIYLTVQEAVDASTQPDDLVKAAGYCTGIEFRGGLTQTVYLSKTLTLRGGYTLTNWTEPDPEANPTTLDAEGLGRVLVVSGTISPTIEGLRLTGGDATGLGSRGGGVYVYAAAATISNCLVYSNTASTVGVGYGGGLHLADSFATLNGNSVVGNVASTDLQGFGGGVSFADSDATLHDNIVRDNIAGTADWSHGGGIYFESSTVTMGGNTIADNIASTAEPGIGGFGGGLSFYDSDATLNDNAVRGNTASATWHGGCGGLIAIESNITLSGNIVTNNVGGTAYWSYGGGLCFSNSDAVLSANTIQGNTASVAADGNGGGLAIEESHVVLEGNVVISNTATLSPTADGWGGGLWVESGTTLTLTNNVVASNQANAGAGSTGDGLWFDGEPGEPTQGTLLHTTIAGNATGGSGQGVYVGDYATLAFINTIISGHDSVGIMVTAGSTATLEGTLWHGNGADTEGEGTIFTGTVNVYGDPAFVDPGAGDYHLGYGSVAIDAGVDAGVTTDIDGDPRPLSLGYDIGADEYPAAGLQLAPDRSASVDPGAAITYTHTLTNVGVQSDALALALDSSQDWATLLTATPITLAPAATATIQVRVAVPAGTLSGTVDTTLLTATSQVDLGLHAAITDTTTVRHVPGLSLAPDRTGSALLGEVVAYAHTLANTGNYTDVFTLTHASSQGWAVTYDTPLTLGVGQTATVAISIAVPASVLSGTVDTTVLTATSQADPGLHAAVADTTTVGGVHWTVYLPLVLKERP